MPNVPTAVGVLCRQGTFGYASVLAWVLVAVVVLLTLLLVRPPPDGDWSA